MCALALTAATVAAVEPSPDVAMIEVEGEATRYWTRWRGPSGQGDVEGEGYVDSWGEDHNILWKVEVPGSGNSSPIVWGDRIFLTSEAERGAKRSILRFAPAGRAPLQSSCGAPSPPCSGAKS